MNEIKFYTLKEEIIHTQDRYSFGMYSTVCDYGNLVHFEDIVFNKPYTYVDHHKIHRIYRETPFSTEESLIAISPEVAEKLLLLQGEVLISTVYEDKLVQANRKYMDCERDRANLFEESRKRGDFIFDIQFASFLTRLKWVFTGTPKYFK